VASSEAAKPRIQVASSEAAKREKDEFAQWENLEIFHVFCYV